MNRLLVRRRQPMRKIRRILIDCTHTYNSHFHAGIQRVVRNIVRHSEPTGRQLGVECVPVIFDQGKLWRIPFELRSEVATDFSLVGRGSLAKRIARRCRKALVPQALYRQAVLRHRRISGRQVAPSRHDILLMLDSTWFDGIWDDVRQFKKNDTIVGAVVYDMIPITHPRFCSRDTISVFSPWLRNALRHSDFLMAISRTVRDELRSFAVAEGFCDLSHDRAFGYFHLGCDLDQQVKASRPSANVRAAFAGPAPYLMVGTVEPRKNHQFALDAFERIWRDSPQTRLCIIGHAGWKCDEIIQRIRSHDRYGRQLFMFHGLGDSELEFCYQNAKALVYPSVVEGFGLPLVEALHRGLRVMASDTPIHREVTQNRCAYFELDHPRSLARMIHEFERHDRFALLSTPDSTPIRDWRESCFDLLSQVLDAGSPSEISRLANLDDVRQRAA